MTRSETLSADETEALLRRQADLQEEAAAVLTELDLIACLSSVGSVRQLGSSALGLMVWRDIDLSVSGASLTIERAMDAMRPLFAHSRVKQVRYTNETGGYNPTGLAVYERFYFKVFFDTQAGKEWKLDISFWMAEGPHPEPIHEAVARDLTSETRLAILWIKEVWHRLPSYRNGVYSTDIYEAVLRHDIRTPAQFNGYLLAQGKTVENTVRYDRVALSEAKSEQDQ